MKSGWVGGITNYAEATVNSGEQFAGFIEKGDVFAFIGELASGKTTFIKGILKGLEYKKPVTSPTFTLVNEYDAKFPVIHIDCYREDELERWIKLGMNDYLKRGKCGYY
jgi:tRNA threonylcarbamoyladenosine biosynthesis protein TsaE